MVKSLKQNIVESTHIIVLQRFANMVHFIIIGLLFLGILYLSVKYYVDNGYYFPVSTRYAVRRYVFPGKLSTISKLRQEMKTVCYAVLQDILNYPMFRDGSDREYHNKVICVFYDRANKTEEVPVAFSATFVVNWNNLRVMHCGLAMVVPEHQRRGIQTLMAINLLLYQVFHGSDILTEIAVSSSYLTIQENTQYDEYPKWREPERKPEKWQIEVTKYMLENHREDFMTSTLATLNEETLVVHKSNERSGGGAWQLIETVNSRASANNEKRKFFEGRLDANNGDDQFYVGKPSIIKAINFLFRKLVTSKHRTK